MKKNLFLLGALAVGLAASAQTVNRLVDTKTVATYDYKAVFNKITNDQKIGTKVNSNGFECNLGAGKTARTDRSGKSYKDYAGENLPAVGATYFGNSDQKVTTLTVGETTYYGANIASKGNPIIVSDLAVGDTIQLFFVQKPSGDETTIDATYALPYAVGDNSAAKCIFKTESAGNLAGWHATETDTTLASTFISGEKIVCVSAEEGFTPYFATYNLQGLLQKVVIIRGAEVITYDYEAEAKALFAAQKIGNKFKKGNRFLVNLLEEGKENRKDNNTTSYTTPLANVINTTTAITLPDGMPTTGRVYIGDENKVDNQGLLISSAKRAFAIDSLNVGESVIIDYEAKDGSNMTYAAAADLKNGIVFTNAAGDTLVSGVTTFKSGDELTLISANIDTIQKSINVALPYFASVGLQGHISKVTILNRIYETVTPLTVTVAEGIENGEVKTASKYEIVAAGDEITVTTTPSEGYVLATLTVTDAEGKEVEVAEGKFTMPASNVTIAATFAKEGTGEKEVYIAYSTTESGVTHNADFAAVVDDKNVATNVADGMSKVTTTGTASIELVAVGGTTPAANKEEGGDYIDKDGNVSQWNEIKWELKNQGDINFNYLIGTGNPYVGLAAEEIVTDGQPTGTYRAQYTYYEEDGSKGLPLTGLYYEFKANASGALRVGIWANKGGRITYVVDKETAKAMNYLVEGYVNGQNNEDGTKKYLTNDEIVALHNEAGKDNKYIIGAGGQPFWGYVSFNVEAGKSYLLFQHSSQVGFSGYEFTKDSVIDIPETFNVKIDVSKLSEKDAKKVSVSSTVVKVDDKVTLTANIQNTDSVVVATATIGGEEVEVTKNEDGTFTVTATDKGDIVFTVALAKEETTPTPVNNIIADEINGDNTIYDLSGRKVVNPTRGIYIKNGKKFLVK